MGARQFHLGWFLQGSSVQAWGEPWTGNIGTEWMVPEFFIEMTRNLERACFDYVLLEDSSYIGESYGGSREIYLHHGLSVPRQDPSVVAALLARETRHIGIVATFGTFACPTCRLARHRRGQVAPMPRPIRAAGCPSAGHRRAATGQAEPMVAPAAAPRALAFAPRRGLAPGMTWPSPACIAATARTGAPLPDSRRAVMRDGPPRARRPPPGPSAHRANRAGTAGAAAA
jgi:hypothetical protein